MKILKVELKIEEIFKPKNFIGKSKKTLHERVKTEQFEKRSEHEKLNQTQQTLNFKLERKKENPKEKDQPTSVTEFEFFCEVLKPQKVHWKVDRHRLVGAPEGHEGLDEHTDPNAR